MVRNSLDPERDPDPDSDFWLDSDPDSMNMDPKHCQNRSRPNTSSDPDRSESSGCTLLRETLIRLLVCKRNCRQRAKFIDTNFRFFLV